MRVLGGVAALPPAEASWVLLTEALLRLCRAFPLPPEAWATAPDRTPESFATLVQQHVAAMLPEDPSTYADAATIERIADYVEQAVQSWPGPGRGAVAVLAAHAVAAAVDDVCGHTFTEWFRTESCVVVEPGVAYPVGVHDPTARVHGSANTRPSRRPTRELDAVPHLRLGDDRAGRYRFTISFDEWYHLAPLNSVEQLRIAALQPNLSLAEFDTDPPIEELRARVAPDAPATFRNLGPTDAARQRTRLIAAIRHASELWAHIVVIPEYCLHETERAALLDAIEQLSNRPLVVVAGSSEHAEIDLRDGAAAPAHSNQAWIALPDHPGFGYQKVFPAEIGGRAEAIVPGAEVTVHMTDEWTLGILVCRDAAAEELVDQYADFGVNLLLVPSFSDRTGTLVSSACHLRTASQAFVAVAVAPAAWSLGSHAVRPAAPAAATEPLRVEAAFDGPYEYPPIALLAPGPEVDAPTGGPGFWLFEAAERQVSWHDAPGVCNQCQ